MYALTSDLLRRSDRRDRMTHLLAALTTLLGTVSLLVLIGIYSGADQRAERTNWRFPHVDDNGPVLQNMSMHFIEGDQVTVVTLAAEGVTGELPTPPGIDHFPRPGEVWLSPALDARLHADTAFDRRLPHLATTDAQRLGRDALASPDEMVAVVGASPSDSTFTAQTSSWLSPQSAQSRVADFAGRDPDFQAGADAPIALIGVVLLFVPILVLAAASGRLGARRREERLARLRLAGASPSQALKMTMIESGLTGSAGAVAGVVVYLLGTVVLARFQFGVGNWFASDLLIGPFGLIVIALGMVGLSVVSAVSSTRRSILAPLATAIGAEPDSTDRKRIWLSAAIALAAFLVLQTSFGHGESGQATAIFLAYGVFWVIGVAVIDRLGRVLVKRARKPATLLAARRLTDDPRGAWRCISGLVLSGFLVGLFTVGKVGIIGLDLPDQLAMVTTQSSDATTVEHALQSAGIPATVRFVEKDTDSMLFGQAGTIVDLENSSDRKAAAEAIAPAFPGRPLLNEEYVNSQSDHDNAAIGRIGLLMLLISALIAAVSTGLSAAASVLDRREVYGRLRFAGTPMEVIDRARKIEALFPAMMLTGATLMAGILVASKAQAGGLGATLDRSDIVTVAGFAAIAVGLIVAAVRASSPLLRSVASREE